MENKIIRKNSYGSMGFGIPIGAESNDIEKAIRSYDIFSRFEIFLNLTHGYD